MSKASTEPSSTYIPSRSSIVCDNGSYALKAGFAGDDFPRAIVPNIVGTPRKEMNIPGYGQRVTYAGQFAKENQGIFDITCPVRNGIIYDWDAMEQIWYHMYYEDLVVPPENFNILHTEPVNNPKSCREKITEIMFELFNVPSTALVPKSVLPLYSNGKTTGIVVDSGHDDTQVVPIYEGYPLQYAVRSMPVGGWHVTRYLMQLLNDRGYTFTTMKDWDHAQNIKEKFCHTALDFDKELAMFTRNMEQNYTLPDGLVVKINSETFRSTEILFDPTLFNIESELGGIHDILYAACNACNVKEQSNMFNNIVLAGGNSLFRLLSERIEIMLSKLVLSTTTIAINATPERKYSTWIGGSILASVPTFEQMWIKKQEYEENGPNFVHQKCFS